MTLTDTQHYNDVNKEAQVQADLAVPVATPSPVSSNGSENNEPVIQHRQDTTLRANPNQTLSIKMADPQAESTRAEEGCDNAYVTFPEDDDSPSSAHKMPHPARQTSASSEPDQLPVLSPTDETLMFDRQVSAPQPGRPSLRTGIGQAEDHPARARGRHSQRLVSWRGRGSMAGEENSVFLLEAQHSSEFNLIEAAENEVEARKIFNNYQFGLRIWKSHVTSRPISTRSEIVQELYSDLKKPLPVSVSTFRVSNILYTILIGWWLALLYCLVGCLMFVTFLGRDYGRMCFRLATYFFWPFGKFVHQYHSKPLHAAANHTNASGRYTPVRSTCPDEDPASPTKDLVVYSKNVDFESVANETASLLGTKDVPVKSKSLWNKPATYLWLPLGFPLLVLVHSIVFMVSWFFVLTIPIAKINGKAITKILLTPPDEIGIGNSEKGLTQRKHKHREIIMYTHQSFNLYYYKYTVDGVNVILANLLVFVILSIVIGYADKDNKLVTPITKCVLGILAILPVTYYIGMAITSISAQSSFAVGAILNATFGSMVEVILFILMLKKGHEEGETCYMELVKSTLTGSILCCILLVPGLSMVTGGLKYRRQKFNPRSANISSSLLFVAIMGVFAPTIFSKIYGNLECDQCQTIHMNSTAKNESGFLCSGCKTVTVGPDKDNSLHWSHVEPLMYTCAIILPLSYLIGLVFFMKTHSTEIFEEFERVQQEEGAGGHHGNAQWSRLKSGVILLLSVTAIALCADMIAANIAPLLNATGMSEYFVGVTLLAIVSMLPEVVNGVQFALQNNVNLGIEIGSAAAIQVCMVQLPIIVLADLIYPLGFGATFNDIHLWAVVFAVIIINYIFQDGKSDYFQGSIVMFIYILLMAMYFFTVTPATAVCKKT